MIRAYTRISHIAFLGLGLTSCLALAACGDTTQFTRTMQNFTKKVKNFTAHNESQNGWFNTSRVKMTGSYTLGKLTITADESHLLTPVQMKDVNDDIQMHGQDAFDDHNRVEIDRLEAIGRDLKPMTTNNDVLVFRIQNTGYDPIDLTQVHFLLIDQAGARKPQIELSQATRQIMDRDAHFIAGPDNAIIHYTSGDMGMIPALSTVYRGVIIPGLNQGSYKALLLNVPGARSKATDGRLSFLVNKH